MKGNMTVEMFVDAIRAEPYLTAGSGTHSFMIHMSDEARRVTAELNGGYRAPEEIRALFSALTGHAVDETFSLFPPFYTDFGKNIRVGKGVFINSGCCFQDQGGISIGDGALIGHQVVIATLNHVLSPERRADMIPAPVRIGRNVWIGSHATILPGVEIGDDAVVSAGAVVTKNVPAGAVVAGVPARVLKSVYEN